MGAPGIQRLTFPLVGAFLALAAACGSARAENPFGVMLFPNPGEDFNLVLARARGLGVSWFRPPTVALERWNEDAPCASCAVYLRSGFRLAVTIRNTADASARQPSRQPAVLATFVKKVRSVIADWKPALLVVENEENSPLFYQDGADAYLAELKAACDVAHESHALCANGGLTGKSAAALTWLDFLNQGQSDRACDFSQRALPGEELCAYHKVADVPPPVRDRLVGLTETLVQKYRTAPIDMVNFHWFGTDSRAFAETANYLARVTGKPAMTNEFGQRRDAADPAAVRPLLRGAIAEGVRIAIWYSVDNADTASLFGPDGRLRPTGWEFQRQMAGLR